MKIIITAGGTLEKIDPVRFISNYSSGKQGYAIAEEFGKNGADVILVSTKRNLAAPDGATMHYVESAEEMLNEVERNLPCDVFISAAAVCDWRAKQMQTHKMKKQLGQNSLNLELVRNPDILQTIANHKNRPKIVVGFAAETDDLLVNAEKKLNKKKCDIIVANDVNGGKVFGSDENRQVYFVDEDGAKNIQSQTKKDVAKSLLNYVLEKKNKKYD